MYSQKFKNQIWFIFLKLFNIIYNYIPFIFVKNFIFKTAGNKIGNKSFIHPKTRFFCFGRITIGNNVTINFGSLLDARCGINIGNNVMIAHNAKIYTLGHDYNSPKLDATGSKVTIEDNVCVFSNVMIMPGVTIEEGAVILPGSVVTKNVSNYTVVGGVPAKELKKREKNIDYQIDYNYWFAN